MAKVISIDKDVSNYNGDSWKLADYPSFAETDNAEEWLGVDSISLIRAKELAFELGGDEAYDIEDEINSATDLDELQDALSELKYFQRDNTYNSSWWGGVVDYGVLTEDGEGYGKGLVLLRMHGGGDPRGNYYDMKAFELDSFIEDFPPYFARLTYYIKTDEGDLVLDTDDMEGYSMNVVSDETGTYEEGDYVKIDEIEDAFDMDGNSFYGFGGGVAIGGLLGAYLGYKIGRARPQKKGFSTEKRVGRNIKSAFTKKKYEGGGDVEKITQADFLNQNFKEARENLFEIHKRFSLPNGNEILLLKKMNSYGISEYNPKTKKELSYDSFRDKKTAMRIFDMVTKKYAQGGDVPMNIGVGSRINFIAINGDTREGMVTRKIDDNHWEVSHNLGIAMVSNTDIVGLAGQGGRKKLFGIFEGGGDVNSMSEEDAKRELEELKRQGKITLSTGTLGNHGLVDMQIVKTNRSMVSGFDESYLSYTDALKHYLRVTRRYDNGGDVRDFSWYQDFKPKANNSMLTTNEKIHNLMSSFGFKVDDIQPNDSSVGIFDGWVMFFDDKGDFREISYNDIIYLLGKMDVSKSDIINESSIYNDDDEYKQGGNVNTGRSWHLDRARHNKRENYEIPMNSRKKRFDNGGGVSSSWYNRLGFGNSRKSSAPMNESLEDYKNRLYAMSNDELAREYARVYTDESRRDVLQKLNEESYLYKPMYLYHLELHHKVESRKNKFGGGGGIKNKNYFDSISNEQKRVILQNIANHYGISIQEAEDEVTDMDAEHLYEYIANNPTLRMSIYNDMQRMNNRFGGGGDVDELPYPYQMQWEKLITDFGNDNVMLMFPSGAMGYYDSRTRGNYSDDSIRQSLKSMNPSNEYAKGGLTEHGLRLGDKIVDSSSTSTTIGVNDKNKKYHIVDLDKGERFDNGGNIDDLVKG